MFFVVHFFSTLTCFVVVQFERAHDLDIDHGGDQEEDAGYEGGEGQRM